MTGELITDSSETGENITALPFSKWSSSIGVDIQDQKDQYVGYGNYLRDFEFDQGTLDQDTEEVIARNTFQKIREIDPEYVPSLELGTIDSDAALIYEAFGQQARDDFYTAVNEAGASRDDFLDEVNSAKQYLVEHDRLGLASLKQVDDDGVTSFRVIGGSNLVNPRQSITDSINRGAFLHNNMAQVNEGLKKTPYGQTLFKAIRNDKISGEFSKAANNSKIKDSYLEIIKDAKNHFITDKEKGAPSALIAKARTLLAKQYSSESDITEDVARNRFQDADIMDALEQVSIMDAYQGGTAKFVSEPDKIDENIKVTKTGIAVPHINLILNKGQFETAIELKAGKGELTNAQVRNLYAGRTAYLTRNYPAYEELFKDSTVEKKWQNHVLKSQKLGQSKAEILDAFIANPKNYSGVKNRIGSFVDSLKDSFTGLFFVLPALLKNETSINILVEQEEDRQNRRQVASIFGDHLGWVHDISTAIAPMVVDVAATGFLISRGMSVGGAGYIGAKEGAKLTAKGLAKSFTGSVLVKEFGESSAEAAARLSATKYIKEGATTKSIQKAIESYSALVGTKLVNNKVVRGRAAENVITSSIFLTAANRSAGGTYATIYSNYDGTHEEKHDKAFGSAMLAAMATGLITAAFSRFGRGGFENVLLGGLSFGQMNYVLGKLSRSKVSPLDTQQIIGNHLKARMKEISPSIFKSLYGRYAKAGTEEFLEEGIDEFVNSFIVSSALKIDTPMLDRISDAIYAGSIGGVIGQGASAIRTSAQKRNAFMRGDIEIFRQKEINELLAKLEATSSPLTRKAVIQRTESLLRGEDISDADYQAYLEEVDKIDKQDQEDTGRPLQTSREQESERAPDKLPRKELEAIRRAAFEAERGQIDLAISESKEALSEIQQDIAERTILQSNVSRPTESDSDPNLPHNSHQGFVEMQRRQGLFDLQRRQGTQTPAMAADYNFPPLGTGTDNVEYSFDAQGDLGPQTLRVRTSRGDAKNHVAALHYEIKKESEIGPEYVEERSSLDFARLNTAKAQLKSLEAALGGAVPKYRSWGEGRINFLKPNQIVVFGSNEDGYHGAGAAGFVTFGEYLKPAAAAAKRRETGYGERGDGEPFVGKWNQKGVAEGYQEGTSEDGASYAIPTVTDYTLPRNDKDRKVPKDQIIESIRKMYSFAFANKPNVNPFLRKELLVLNGDGDGALSGYTGQEFAEMYLAAGPIPPNITFRKSFVSLLEKIEDAPRAVVSKQDMQLPNAGVIQDDVSLEQETPAPVAEPKVVYVKPEAGKKSTDLVIAAEKRGDGINTLRQRGVKKETHFGNPFRITQPWVDTPEVREKYEVVVNKYKRWLRGDEVFKDIEPARREWILKQIDDGNLDGQNLIYYKKIPVNHAIELR